MVHLIFPEGRHIRVDNKIFYFDIGQNNRGVFMRVSEVSLFTNQKLNVFFSSDCFSSLSICIIISHCSLLWNWWFFVEAKLLEVTWLIKLHCVSPCQKKRQFFFLLPHFHRQVGSVITHWLSVDQTDIISVSQRNQWDLCTHFINKYKVQFLQETR